MQNAKGDALVSPRITPVDSRTFTTCMELLQEGFVASVAATAGCTAEFKHRDVHGFDVLITRPSEAGTQEVSVYAQLKNTTTKKPDPRKSHFSYKFKDRDNLKRLAGPRNDPKAILLVMTTTAAQMEWTEVSHDFLTLRHCCYWVHLEGMPVDPNVRSPTVRVPTANRFDAAALRELMDKLDRGLPLR